MSPRTRRAMPAMLRYTLFQIPGLALAGVALVAAVEWAGLSRSLALILLGVWVLKDVLLYRAVRVAYQPGPPHGSEALVGSLGVALGPLTPEGWVRVGPERWRARLARDVEPVSSGRSVRVRDVDGFTLTVEPDNGTDEIA